MTKECFYVINLFTSKITLVLMIFLLSIFFLAICSKESKKGQILKYELRQQIKNLGGLKMESENEWTLTYLLSIK